jgi:NAD(P)-dependent dehydrogenase (short-subunit alcohol dehydrogenase family)
MKTVLIIGASRGLGLEFVNQYLADGWKVMATARKASDVKRLAALGATACKVNVTEPADFAALKTLLARKSIDVAIYNAGVFGPRTSGVEAVEKADFDAVMRANVWGAMHATPAVAPAVARAKGKGVFVFVSSTMGSITKMSGPNAVIYRASKSALNAVVKAASLEWGSKGVVSFVIHPGWVKTDMGGQSADIEPSTSIAGMRKVIATTTAKRNGGFFDYTGEAMPW